MRNPRGATAMDRGDRYAIRPNGGNTERIRAHVRADDRRDVDHQDIAGQHEAADTHDCARNSRARPSAPVCRMARRSSFPQERTKPARWAAAGRSARDAVGLTSPSASSTTGLTCSRPPNTDAAGNASAATRVGERIQAARRRKRRRVEFNRHEGRSRPNSAASAAARTWKPRPRESDRLSTTVTRPSKSRAACCAAAPMAVRAPAA